MAIKSNSSDKPVVKEGKLYTGLHNMRVVAINPTKAELEKLGYNPRNESNYLSKAEDGAEKVRIDFYLTGKNPEGEEGIRTKVALFLENRERVNKDGTKREWINDFGRTAWGSKDAPPTGLKWYDASTARPAKVGEGDLIAFIINWMNVAPTDEASLDNLEGLFKGDYSELKQLLTANPNNEVRVLLGVREGKYQSVYNKYFDRATNKRNTYWETFIKAQTEAGYPPREDFQNSFMFQEYAEPETIEDKQDIDDKPDAQQLDAF